MASQQTCIFCDLPGKLSKEHFWPEWLAPHIRELRPNGYISEWHESTGKGPTKLVKRSEKQGSVINKRFRVVCIKCNNGWMSKLEESVKPILLSMLCGSAPNLTGEELHRLAVWISLKSMVSEHNGNGSLLTPPEDRHLLYSKAIIPPYYRIFLGFQSSETKAAFRRHSTAISRFLSPPTPPLPPGITRNLQTVSFITGRLFIHLIAARVTGFDVDEVFKIPSMARIWPSGTPSPSLESLHPIDDVEIMRIAGQIDILTQLPSVVHIDDLPRKLLGL